MVSICSVLRRRQSQLSGAKKLSCIHSLYVIVTGPCPYLMRSCDEFSAPCSCLTVVAAEATWTEEAGAGVVTGGDGPAVTAVPAPGSIFTVEESKC